MFWQTLGRANAPEGHFAISCAENMVYFKQTAKKDFIMPLKSNRKVAFAPQPKKKGQWHAKWLCHLRESLDSLDFDTDSLPTLYLEGIPFALRVMRQVFTNDDAGGDYASAASQGILYLCTSDLSLSVNDVTTIYQKRWKCESCQRQLYAGRRVSQIVKKQRGVCEIADETTSDTEQPFFRVACGVCENGNDAFHNKVRSFRVQGKVKSSGTCGSLKQISRTKARQLAYAYHTLTA